MSARNEFEALKQGLGSLAKQGYIASPEEEHEEFVPPSNLSFNNSGNGDNYDYAQHDIKDSAKPQLNTELQGYNTQDNPYFDEPAPNVDNEDERLWPGGPLKSEVESWKKQFTDVYLADDIDPNIVFVYRPINRYEYKTIVAALNTDPLMREEMICEQCVLFPYEYSYGMMSNGNAGNVSTLSEQILIMSGFSKASVPRRL